MKKRNFISVFAFTFLVTLLMASCNGCLNDDNKIPPNCYDGILNNGEEQIDCGGTACKECDHCTNGIYEPERGETWRDCGGECAPCEQCNNGVLDGDEYGIDCGGLTCGPCTSLCNDGLLNGLETEIDCGGVEGVGTLICVACPTCTDNTMNGDEIGIDCGGSNCTVCPTSGSCRNSLIDGNEFWIDCGGSQCPNCRDTLSFKYQGQTKASNNITASGPTPFAATATTNENGNWVLALNPPAGLIDATSYLANPANAALYSISYDINGVTYSSSNTGGNVTVTCVRYVNFTLSTPVKNFFRFTFSGTLKSDTGATLTISNGVLQKTI